MLRQHDAIIKGSGRPSRAFSWLPLFVRGFLQPETAPFLRHRHESVANAPVLSVCRPSGTALGQAPAVVLSFHEKFQTYALGRHLRHFIDPPGHCVQGSL